MDQLVGIYKLLSDETRLRILMLLAHEELCVCQISGVLDVAQPKVSKSLAKLRDMKIVADERKEKFVYYRLKTDNTALANNLEYINSHLAEYPRLSADRERLADKELYLNQCCLD